MIINKGELVSIYNFEFDGKKELLKLAKIAGLSKEQLVAEHTLFTHPKTVLKTQNKNLFSIIRDQKNRGKILNIKGVSLMACDNTGPQHAFEWSNGNIKKTDIQINHIYSDSKNVEIYTSVANLCATPTFIAKLTDTDPEIRNLLKYRAYELYRFYVNNPPEKPEAYSKLKWMPFLEPLNNLETHLRNRLKKCKKSRTTISCKEIGWYYSNYIPDKGLI